ncbi:hypothetical protein AB7M29_003159 [Pseudomonas sp. F-14 TE3623]|jgi:hypothetical protein
MNTIGVQRAKRILDFELKRGTSVVGAILELSRGRGGTSE